MQSPQLHSTEHRRSLNIALAIAGSLFVATTALAQTRDLTNDTAQDEAVASDSPMPDIAFKDVWSDAPANPPETAASNFVEPPDIDWSILNTDPRSLYETQAAINRKVAAAAVGDPWSWTRSDKPDGTSAVAIKQPISPFWDARVGADLNVTTRTPTTSSEVLAQKIANGNQLSQSSGSAWAAMTAPGVGSIWDKTALEARTDPSQDQSKFGALLSKSVPFGGDKYSLTLQNGYNVTQQTLVPVFGLGTSSRIYDLDQSAKLGIVETGTSFIAEQTHSSNDAKWLRRFGAEQKLFGGVTVTGSVSETPDGVANRTLSAGFKHSW